MNKANECTCPSGDGSLVHPCPAHPAVEQAGGDRWDALQSIMEWTAAKNIPDDRKLCLIRNAARAALAQPSPAHELDPLGLAPHAEAFNEAPDEAIRPEQAEAERPVVVARLYRSNDLTMTPFAEVQKPLPLPASDGTLTVDALMTVAQHERIVEARWNRAMDLMGEHVARISEKLKAERDAALARVAELESKLAELEKQEPVALANRGNQGFWVEWTEAAAGLYGSGIKLYAATVAQAQHSVPEGWMLVECGIWTQEQVDEMQKTVTRFRNSEFVDDRALAMAVADAGQCKAPEISLAELLAAAPGKEVGHE
ncbi:hypothetical protein PZS78_20380 [Pseudomonas aeruginosa]|uniref:hypothetical protein n=1 Tax=Pseudomonas aeruginosa TaxID=287 RepID=UPI002B265737|nr:hypothetical protein [Pseudomonas aeruginosa]MEA8474011.1 hypothetical protein [Pseudomonas aeruginosa]HCL4061843.1 hypothetical protein [Pseudomonas aeruginosa]